MFQLIRVGGAPGFSSILWSQGRSGGNFFDSSLLNTFLNDLYDSGTFNRFSLIVAEVIFAQGCLLVLGWKRAWSMLLARSTMGSCE